MPDSGRKPLTLVLTQPWLPEGWMFEAAIRRSKGCVILGPAVPEMAAQMRDPRRLMEIGISEEPPGVTIVDEFHSLLPQVTAVFLAVLPKYIRACCGQLAGLAEGVDIVSLSAYTDPTGACTAELIARELTKHRVFGVSGVQVPPNNDWNSFRAVDVSSASNGADATIGAALLRNLDGVRVAVHPELATQTRARLAAQMVSLAAGLLTKPFRLREPESLARLASILMPTAGLSLGSSTMNAALLGQILYGVKAALHPGQLGHTSVQISRDAASPFPDPREALIATLQACREPDPLVGALVDALQSESPSTTFARTVELLPPPAKIAVLPRWLRDPSVSLPMFYFPQRLASEFLVAEEEAEYCPDRFVARPGTIASVWGAALEEVIRYFAPNDAEATALLGLAPFYTRLFEAFLSPLIRDEQADKMFKVLNAGTSKRALPIFHAFMKWQAGEGTAQAVTDALCGHPSSNGDAPRTKTL
jgi:hypothetical protein